MPIQFAAPGSLGRGRRPQQVPPPAPLPSGAVVSPAANELPGLAQVVGDNLHAQGTPMRQGVSAQLEPLARPVDPADLEAAGALADPTKLGPMASYAVTRTQTMDTPQQAQQRLMQMDTNRSLQQQQTELHAAGSLVQAVTAPQMAQRAAGDQRLMHQQVAQATGQDQTGALADAQAWSARYRLSLMDPQAQASLDKVAARFLAGPSEFAIAA